MKNKISEMFEGENSSLRKTYEEATYLFLHLSKLDKEKIDSVIKQSFQNGIEQERLRLKEEVEKMNKEIFKWDYKEGDGERKEGYNQAIEDVLKLLV